MALSSRVVAPNRRRGFEYESSHRLAGQARSAAVALHCDAGTRLRTHPVKPRPGAPMSNESFAISARTLKVITTRRDLEPRKQTSLVNCRRTELLSSSEPTSQSNPKYAGAEVIGTPEKIAALEDGRSRSTTTNDVNAQRLMLSAPACHALGLVEDKAAEAAGEVKRLPNDPVFATRAP